MTRANEDIFIEMCKKYHKQIFILLGNNPEKYNVFDTKQGKVVLEFDKDKTLRGVRLADKTLYRT